jgi:hypothetical protein
MSMRGLLARKADTWAGYKTTGTSGFHLTGHGEKCMVNYDTFTCDHYSHDKSEQEYKRRGRKPARKTFAAVVDEED